MSFNKITVETEYGTAELTEASDEVTHYTSASTFAGFIG